jgi:ribose transport system ATP-binding protein
VTIPVLRTEKLIKTFGETRALDNVSVEIRSREILGLVGENGAGKSTLLKILAGLYRPDAGEIVLRGEGIVLRSIAVANDAGIGMVFQEQSILPNLSVAENIMLGYEDEALKYGVYQWGKLNDLATAQLAKLDSKILSTEQVGLLSFADRQVVEIAKVLTVAERSRHEPIILLDEPTSVLEAEEVEIVLTMVRRLREFASVVFISHRLDEVLRVSDRVYVMTNGRVVAERLPDSLGVAELQELMLGHELNQEYAGKTPRPADIAGPVRLSVRELKRARKFEGVTFDLRSGEILGIAGVAGSGREALCRVLFGAEVQDSGQLLLNGSAQQFTGPEDAVRAGIGYVPAERRVEGIVGGMSVRENMTLAHLREVMRGPMIDLKREKELASKWIRRLRIKSPSSATMTSMLSGGNQQKVALTKWLIARNLQVLILDHPMRGLDVGAKLEIFTLIRELAQNGIGVILIADTLEELIALSSTIMVMRDGKVCGRFATANAPATNLQILELMT